MGSAGANDIPPTALVLYGSETGNAHDIAEEVHRTLRRIRYPTHLTSLNSIDLSLLPHNTTVIVIVSTTGQGEFPSNAISCWKQLLRKRLAADHLTHLRYTCFGLGDSSYPKYNFAARKLWKRFSQLGAQELYIYGEADEQHPEGSDVTFLPWLDGLRQVLLDKSSSNEVGESITEAEFLPPEWELRLTEEEIRRPIKKSSDRPVPHELEKTSDVSKITEHWNGNPIPLSTSTSSFIELSVHLDENTRVTPEAHWQDVRHLIFSCSKDIRYFPGDVLTLHPLNPSSSVDEIIKLMDWSTIADSPLLLCPNAEVQRTEFEPALSISRTLPPVTTLRYLLTHHLDLNAVPRRSFFSNIVHFTNDEFQKNRLVEFTNPDYVEELYDYTTRPRRSILEVLQEFDTVKIPWRWAASVFPELRGRQFSIASGGSLLQSSKHPAKQQSKIELLVALVKYKTVIKKVREGTCSRYLASLSPGTMLKVSLLKGSLIAKKSEIKKPIIMISPGTGLAPMRALIWQRLQWAQELRKLRKEQSGLTDTQLLVDIAPNVLFFGARSRSADNFFAKEWEEIRATGTLPLEVYSAFSRDQPNKVYVQDLVRRESQLVWDLIGNQDGIIYVCGSSRNMPKAVRLAIVDIVVSAGGLTQEEGEQFVATLEKDGRYRQETW
ncbi:NAPDH-dependent diflavin reductase [Agyrium rufum]|nr:NAPDH-dependent diflavin reductase [Agyrium rufum]